MSNIEKEWYLGIDFGTSNTCVIAYEAKDGKLYSGDLTEGIGDDFSNISSCISLDVNPTEISKRLFYVGEEVRRHPILQSFKGLKTAAREITPNNGLFGKNAIKYPFDGCGLNSTLEMGNSDYSLTITVKKLVIQFLKKVLHVEDEKFGINENTVREIVIGCPASKMKESSGYNVSYEDTLKGLLTECFILKEFAVEFTDKIRVEAEPELAGVTYLFSDSERADKKVLVIDIGGGTSDFSVLEYENGKVKASNIGSCETAGDAIDKLIFEMLPEGIPHSKVKCREWKEALFADKIPSGATKTMIPKAMSALKPVEIGKIAGKTISLSYMFENANSSNDYVVIGEKITTEVFDKIGNALKYALDDNKIIGINTIFFVGGTSIITPLREKLVDISKSYCETDFSRESGVITMFGKQTRTLKADWDNPLTVTCYNAVAIGACIKAMGEDLLRIKPKVYCREFYDDKIREFDTIDKDLIIVKDKEIPFAYLFYQDWQVKDWISDVLLPFDLQTIGLGDSPSSLKNYKIKREQVENIDGGLLVYAVLTKSGIAYKACSCNKNPDVLSDEELSSLIQNATKIEIEIAN